jgi:hypothetical protein
MDSLVVDAADEEITLESLRRAVLNEVHSPELLPFENAIVEHFSSMIAQVCQSNSRFEGHKSQQTSQNQWIPFTPH